MGSNAFADIPPTRIGRVRPPTSEEQRDGRVMLRADAVLSLVPNDVSLEPLERHVADLIDGHRPVARIKKRSGLSTADVIEGLRKLSARGLVRLLGIVEYAGAPLVDDANDDADFTSAHGARDVIPPHVMLEIQQMLVDIERARAAEDDDSVVEGDHVEFEDAATKQIKAHQDQTE
jgi:hypothetical protein